MKFRFSFKIMQLFGLIGYDRVATALVVALIVSLLASLCCCSRHCYCWCCFCYCCCCCCFHLCNCIAHLIAFKRGVDCSRGSNCGREKSIAVTPISQRPATNTKASTTTTTPPGDHSLSFSALKINYDNFQPDINAYNKSIRYDKTRENKVGFERFSSY